MIDLNSTSIPVTLHFDQRFKKDVNTSYSGIQIPTNVYHGGTLNTNEHVIRQLWIERDPEK
jgi:hypothetical protein